MRKGFWGVVSVALLGGCVVAGGIGCGGSGSASGTNTTGTVTTTTTTTTTGSVTGYSAVLVAPKVANVFPSGLNDSGVVAGFASPTANSVAFTWTATGGYTQLPVPVSITQGAQAMAINNSAVVVGSGTNAANHSRALVWTTGAAKDIGDLGGGIAVANGVDNEGRVVGYSVDSSGNFQAFFWTSAGGMKNLGTDLGGPNEAWAINDSEVIVGGTGFTGQDGFAYSPTLGPRSLGDFGGGTSIGRAVNASGEVVGLAADSAGLNHAFTWTVGGGIKKLAEPTGTTTSSAYGINASGMVVGSVVGTSEAACAWSPSGTIQLLSPITTGLPTGVTLAYAQGVNTGGTIVAYGNDGNAYLLSPKVTPARRPLAP